MISGREKNGASQNSSMKRVGAWPGVLLDAKRTEYHAMKKRAITASSDAARTRDCEISSVPGRGWTTLIQWPLLADDGSIGHRGQHTLGMSRTVASGSWSCRCLSMAVYVAVAWPKTGPPPPEGA